MIAPPAIGLVMPAAPSNSGPAKYAPAPSAIEASTLPKSLPKNPPPLARHQIGVERRNPGLCVHTQLHRGVYRGRAVRVLGVVAAERLLVERVQLLLLQRFVRFGRIVTTPQRWCPARRRRYTSRSPRPETWARARGNPD